MCAIASGGTPSDTAAGEPPASVSVGWTDEALRSGSNEALDRGEKVANRAVSSICVSRLLVLHSLICVEKREVHIS
jgi:hypothetical protein